MEPNKAKKSAIVLVQSRVMARWRCRAPFSALQGPAHDAAEQIRAERSADARSPSAVYRHQGQQDHPGRNRSSWTGRQAKQTAPAPLAKAARSLVGGDTRERSQLSEKDKRGGGLPEDRHLEGQTPSHRFFPLFSGRPKGPVTALRTTPGPRSCWNSKFVQGLFNDPLHSTSVRAEDLHLEGLEGAFLQRFLREALAAHGELHYDVVHGKKGFVFSFVRDECPFVAKALPVMARVLARSGYRIAKLKEPILEMHIGLQRLFLTQFEDRVYLANGLEALINVMESLRPPARKPAENPAGPHDAGGSLRGQAASGDGR